MKNILLSSAAIALLAGAASAEVTWSGDAELGYNDDHDDGVYWDAGLSVAMSQELNNGWTASASLDVDLQNNGDSTMDLGSVDSSDWVLSLSNDMLGLSFGDVDYALASFAFAGEADNSTGEDNADDDGADAGILVTGGFGAVEFAVSTGVDGNDTNNYQAWVGAEFGAITAGLVYTDDEDVEATIASVGASLAGADITANFGEVNSNTVYSLEVAYPIGDVTLGAYYTVDENEADDSAYGVSVDYAAGPIVASAYYNDNFGSEEYGVGAGYDFGMGLVVTAGYIDGDSPTDDDFSSYIVAEYDLGGGATFLASFADQTNAIGVNDNDDIDTVTGGYELKEGTTLALTFEF